MTTQLGRGRWPRRRRAKATKMSHARTTRLMASLSRRFIAGSTKVPAGQETTDSSERTVPSPRPSPLLKGRGGRVGSDSAMGGSCRALIEPELEGEELQEDVHAAIFVRRHISLEGLVAQYKLEYFHRLRVRS